MTLSFPLVLASKSPRRKELLELLQVEFQQISSDIDEIADTGLPYEAWAQNIAQKKALEVSHRLSSDHIIIAADTMVFLEKTSFGKPSNSEEAKRMLRTLSGREHEVITGVYIIHPKGEVEFSSRTLVQFSELDEDSIEFYIEKYKPFDKAGSYGIQDYIGMVKVTQIQGSYSNVMGLPMNELEQVLIYLEELDV